ncbi:hypothetical protein [Algoriphagus persicinus]|uniref:hypothetical protein n=1 Tax=Algoriphagus persicinus TaxID=3108754 RepID=UPI002B398988|nr:hypothetical protein [Algoriphagus sp. E1-3-M2]MEB2786966.1 hypothetical protein [Algoriphagus sp. E1-3-M2]
MNTRILLKNLTQEIPYFPGNFLKFVPYRVRLGNDYTKYSKLVLDIENNNNQNRLNYLVYHLNSIVNYAQKNIPFYQKLYGRSCIKIQSVSDFEKLPIITRKEIREYTKQSSGKYFLNTGGSSGEPLSFYVDKNAWAREWAHMHYIWGKSDYNHTDLMITMLGKNIGEKVYQYNAVHNEFRLNPYINAGDYSKKFINLLNKFPVKFFQGYPSSVYNFLKEIEPFLSDDEKINISNQIKCCFLSSEYPLPYMIDYIRDIWNLNYISWYGHSEMCVLAYDDKMLGNYKPLITYGYAEEVNNILIGTSFHNYDMPLIRYSTDDGIEGEKDEFGILDSFKITSGRDGDFILDKYSKKIPLTSFIFGRHHKIFEVADFVQIKQSIEGHAEFWITIKNNTSLVEESISTLFDLSNINMTFKFKIIKQPVLTNAGKLKLKI